jgi:GntR family transcriptional regulator
MIFHIDMHSGVPIFRQLIDQVKLQVATGTLKPGDEMPSIRTLAVPLGVNPMTISKAYSILEREGVLERRPGRPLVVGELDQEQMMIRKIDQLKESLRPTVSVVRQLDIDREEAVRVFHDMLQSGGDGQRPEHKDGLS